METAQQVVNVALIVLAIALTVLAVYASRLAKQAAEEAKRAAQLAQLAAARAQDAADRAAGTWQPGERGPDGVKGPDGPKAPPPWVKYDAHPPAELDARGYCMKCGLDPLSEIHWPPVRKEEQA